MSTATVATGSGGEAVASSGPGVSSPASHVDRWYEAGTGRYAKPDPLTAYLIDKGEPVALQNSLNDYAYALSSPAALTDPLGLSPCGYYDYTCRATGCDYPCNVAPKHCEQGGSALNWIDTSQTKDCIRICLIVSDALDRRFPRPCCSCPDNPNCINETCITDYHERCFQACGSRSPWQVLTVGGGLFPGPGPFFPGAGC